MQSVLMIGGPAAGNLVDVDAQRPSINWPNVDGTYSLYTRGVIVDSGKAQHVVYTLAGADPIIELLAAYQQHG